MLSNYQAHVIHLDHRIDREPIIQKLQKSLSIPIETFKASNGSEWWNDNSIPKKHPWQFDTIPIGMVGCTHSHISLLRKIYETSDKGVLLFEDDTELVQPAENLKAFIKSVKDFTEEAMYGVPKDTREWDIFLLGATEYVNSKPVTHEIQRVYRFWGTHAMYIKREKIPSIISTFEKYLSLGIFLPPDWLYNKAIEEKHLVAYGPSQPKLYLQQSVGLVSSITNKVRL
jgi:GR25 family glycosyltransferase involved in LPS biosynthesis